MNLGGFMDENSAMFSKGIGMLVAQQENNLFAKAADGHYVNHFVALLDPDTSSPDEAIAFLRGYAHIQESVVLNGRQLLCHRSTPGSWERDSSAREKVKALTRIRDIARKKEDKSLAERVDQDIVAFGDQINRFHRDYAFKGKEGLITIEAAVFAYCNAEGEDACRARLTTARKILGQEGKGVLSFDKRVEQAYELLDGLPEGSAVLIANTLMQIADSGDEENAKAAAQVARRFAIKQPETYKALETLLLQHQTGKKIVNKVVYEGTPIIAGAKAEFESEGGFQGTIDHIPDTWNYLDITLEKVGGLESVAGTRQKITNGVPEWLGIRDAEIGKFDKNKTAKILTASGVFRALKLIATNAEEAKRIRTEILPAAQSAGYTITYLESGRARQFDGERVKESLTRLFAYADGKSVELRTSSETTANEVTPFYTNLKYLGQKVE